MKKLKALFASFAATATLGATLLVASPVAAQVDVFPQCAGDVSSRVCKGGDKLFGAGSIWNRILNTLTYVIGAVAVLMIIMGGFRYIMSSGDQKKVEQAKNTILYSITGLILAIMANAIVNFVLANL